MTEPTMYVNEVILCGELARDPEVSFTDNGTQIARLALCLREFHNDREFKTYVPCEIWGKAAETAGELSQGDTILVKGKLTWKKRGEKQGLEVMSWSVQTPIVAAETALHRN